MDAEAFLHRVLLVQTKKLFVVTPAVVLLQNIRVRNAILSVQIKRLMATVYITLKIMPESVDIDLSQLQTAVTTCITTYGGRIAQTMTEPVAFGLQALKIIFTLDESRGGTDPLEQQIQQIAGVQSADVVDVRRAVG